MTLKKFSSVFLIAAIFFVFTFAQADADYKTTLTLTIGAAGQKYDEAYILSIPKECTISTWGWNSLGDITVTRSADMTTSFDVSKKLVVTATSENNTFKLTANGVSDTISYDVMSGDSASTAIKATTFEFSAAEINKTGGTSKPIGVNVENYSTKAAGDYEGEITYTVSVENDAPAENIVNLATLTADYNAQNGDILTGTLAGNYKITIADGASITLSGATINGVNNDSYKWAGITPLGDATITLEGTNSVKGFDQNYPGIFAATNHTLTIKGTGILNASSNGCGAGIGGGYEVSCGNIAIEGGTITATGGDYSAGIGGGMDRACGTITIIGGTIEANGGDSAAGIGGGDFGSCGDITIADTVTKVTATKQGYGTPYSIGAGGDGGTCGTVTIGGTVGAISTSP